MREELTATQLRAVLDQRVRELWQATKDWPERPPRLAAALEGAQVAVDRGLPEPLQPALDELEAAWSESHEPPIAAVPSDPAPAPAVELPSPPPPEGGA